MHIPIRSSKGPFLTIKSGSIHSCALSLYYLPNKFLVPVYEYDNLDFDEVELICFGGNNYGQTDIPSDILTTLGSVDGAIDSLTLGPYVSCISFILGSTRCWGNTDVLGQIPVIVLKGALGIGVGGAGVCVVHQILVDGVGDEQERENYYRNYRNNNSTGKRRKLDYGGKNLDGYENTGKIFLNNTATFDDKYIHNNPYPNISCFGDCSTGICDVPTQLSSSSSFRSISVGSDHACLTSNSKSISYFNNRNRVISCWGGNMFSQSVVPEEFNNIKSIVYAAKFYTCGMVEENGYMRCWGKINTNNQNSAPARQVGVGDRHYCTVAGVLRCRGNNWYGQSAINNLKIYTDHQIQGYNSMKVNWEYHSMYVAAGYDYTCLVSVQGVVDCYGLNVHSQTDLSVQLQKSHSVNVKKVYSGLMHSCAIYDKIIKSNSTYKTTSSVEHFRNISSKITCWGGHNSHNELTPTFIKNHNIKLASVGDEHTCAVQSNQSLIIKFLIKHINNPNAANYSNKINSYFLQCWGYNEQGQTDPIRVNYTSIPLLTSGGAHNCAVYDLFVQGLPYLACWGSNNHGQAQVPYPCNSLGRYVWNISAGAVHTCVILMQDSSKRDFMDFSRISGLFDGAGGSESVYMNNDAVYSSNLFCWGTQSYGQFNKIDMRHGGLLAHAHIQSIDVSQGLQPVQVSSSYSCVCVLGDIGEIYCFGECDNEDYDY